MGTINYTNELAAGLNAYFFKMMDEYISTNEQTKLMQQVFDIVNVDDKTTNFGWYGTIPRMRKWRGNRQYSEFNDYSYSITTDPFEVSIAVERRELENYDKYGGLVMTKIQQMAQEVAQHMLRETAAFIETAGTANCYDSQFMVDTDHADPGGKYTTVQTNKGVTALSDITYAAARLAMGQFKDDYGRIVGLQGDILIVPSALEDTAKLILENEWNVDSMDRNFNVNRNTARLWVNPFLTDANDWFLAHVSSATKPFVIAMAQDNMFTKVMDERARHEGRYLFGADAEFGLGFGNWRYIYGAIVP